MLRISLNIALEKGNRLHTVGTQVLAAYHRDLQHENETLFKACDLCQRTASKPINLGELS